MALESNDSIQKDFPRFLQLQISHVAGGLLGGALMGAAYQQRPLNGIAAFVPLMMAIGAGESIFLDMVEAKRREYEIQNQSQ